MPKRKRSIVIALRDAHLRSILLERFEREGFTAEGTEDVSEAEKKASKLRPTIFFAEFVGETAELRKLLKHWRSLPTLSHAKVVLFFSGKERRYVDEALHGGADQVILEATLTTKELTKLLLRIAETAHV